MYYNRRVKYLKMKALNYHHLKSILASLVQYLSQYTWGDTHVCCLRSHLHFSRAFKRPHLSNSSAPGQLEEMWSSHNNPSSLICTWRVITDPINVPLPSVEHFLLYNLTQHFQEEVLKWITFVQSVKLFASESSPEKNTHGHWGISCVAAT